MSQEQSPASEQDLRASGYCEVVKGVCPGLDSLTPENRAARVDMCRSEAGRIGLASALFIHSHSNTCVPTSFALITSQLEEWTGPVEEVDSEFLQTD